MSITTSVAVSEETSRTRETLESALLLKSPSPEDNVVSEKQTFSVDDDKTKTKKSQLPVTTYVDESVDVNKKAEVPVLVESKGTETEEEDFIGTELQSKLDGGDCADAAPVTVMEEDTTLEVAKVEPDDVIIIKKEVDDSVIIIIQAAIRGFLVCSLVSFFFTH